MAVLSCQDPNNLLGDLPTTSVPPVIDKVTPDSRVKIGTEFDITVELTDGEKSPLASVSGTLYYVKKGGGSIDTVMLSELASQTVSGTSDSTGWAGSSFKAATLDTGDYVIHIEALDNANNLTTGDFGFSMFDLPFAANYSEMYVGGNFNGWQPATSDAADVTAWKKVGEMTLTGPHTWTLDSAQLDGGAFKFKNTYDWTDIDWGDDADCSGTVVVTTGGGPNIDCGYTGLSKITFNDETLNYTIVPLVSYGQVLTDLYLVGDFNEFQGNDNYHFSLEADNEWVIDEAYLKGGDYFRFSEGADLSGKIYGAGTVDTIAVPNGGNIKVPDAAKTGYYKVTFNDKTLVYSMTFVRGDFGLYIIGDATLAGWDNTKAYGMETIGDKKYRTYQYLTTANFQFLPLQGSWSGQIGKGDTDGTLGVGSGNNLSVATEGFYRIDVDLNAMTYTITESNWGIIGSATPTAWDSDTNMTLVNAAVGGFSWTINMTLVDGEIKFRENDDWGINYGGGGADGELVFNSSSNIAVSAGTYDITITLDSENGYTYEIK